ARNDMAEEHGLPPREGHKPAGAQAAPQGARAETVPDEARHAGDGGRAADRGVRTTEGEGRLRLRLRRRLMSFGRRFRWAVRAATAAVAPLVGLGTPAISTPRCATFVRKGVVPPTGHATVRAR